MSKLPEGRFQVAAHANNRWAATLEYGVAFEEAFKPEFWAHTAKRLRPGDIIEVRAEDGSFYAELYVRAVGALFAKVEALFAKELGAGISAEADKLDVKWNVGKRCFAVIRRSDNTVIRDGFQIKEDAIAWMNDHNKQMAA
jgi:hypothetical protein